MFFHLYFSPSLLFSLFLPLFSQFPLRDLNLYISVLIFVLRRRKREMVVFEEHGWSESFSVSIQHSERRTELRFRGKYCPFNFYTSIIYQLQMTRRLQPTVRTQRSSNHLFNIFLSFSSLLLQRPKFFST